MAEKISPFKNRLKTALDIRQMRAVDLCSKTKISQSTMSQYLSGYAEPKKQRLYLIADSLNVNPSWLMGLDEPIERDSGKSANEIIQNRLKEKNLSLEELAKSTGVSLYWLQHLDTFIPGQFGTNDIGYEWITKVAENLNLPGGLLRKALARQEIPVPDDLPKTSAKEDFSVIDTSLADMIYNYNSLNETGKTKAYEYIADLAEQPKYQASINKPLLNAAHERTDIEITDEMKQHDDDIMNDDDF